ncbi:MULTISPECIES: hypothetical protein [Wolbachia]|uniref:hypothetical protein n=1 Tax=Wolbachia TaxID=953 RepID=UPI0002403EF4|nr:MULTISPECIES: hypothetical protein [Wolbachia]UYC23694.1 hypothetical protein L3551_00165 [Wolbachia endosymbiont of Aedes aegypti]QBB83801.1 hypothetical protein DEJ70_03125 [Wolbachia pipientis wAlbB]QDW08604.1 hypothetical protein CO539_003115 [Wolbachia pipientis]QDW09797.1 hypothetical protein CO538_003120 [Wolbachia pipientis]QZA83994.1 hypothetical protein K1Y75_03040 [Wolbachia pipientis]
MVKFTQDSASLTLHGVDLLNLCHRQCENKYEGNDSLTKINRSWCKADRNRNIKAPEHHSPEKVTLSEQLTDIASNLRFESIKLSLISDEIDNYNSMSF